MTKGNYAAARDYYERAEKIYPSYPPLEINMGINDGALGNAAAAEQHFKRALAMIDDVDGHFYYARWLVSAGRAPEAIAQLTVATRIDPARAEPRTLLIRIYTAAGDGAERDRLVQRARSYDPRYVLLPLCATDRDCFDRGLPAIGGKQFLDAALLNRQAVRYNPNAADAWTNLGWSLAQLGLDAAAETAFHRAIELQPNDEQSRNNLEWLQERRAHRVQ
jgi:tetratricopeptide (TPR) repeat protein